MGKKTYSREERLNHQINGLHRRIKFALKKLRTCGRNKVAGHNLAINRHLLEIKRLQSLISDEPILVSDTFTQKASQTKIRECCTLQSKTLLEYPLNLLCPKCRHRFEKQRIGL